MILIFTAKSIKILFCWHNSSVVPSYLKLPKLIKSFALKVKFETLFWTLTNLIVKSTNQKCSLFVFIMHSVPTSLFVHVLKLFKITIFDIKDPYLFTHAIICCLLPSNHIEIPFMCKHLVISQLSRVRKLRIEMNLRPRYGFGLEFHDLTLCCEDVEFIWWLNIF